MDQNGEFLRLISLKELIQYLNEFFFFSCYNPQKLVVMVQKNEFRRKSK